MKDEDYILIGRIRGSRGNRGEVVVEPMASDRNRFLSLKRVFVGATDQDLDVMPVERVWFHGLKTVMKLGGIDSIAGAGRLKGFGVYVPESEKIELPSDTYFWHDLVGMDVVDDVRGTIGQVASILPAGGADLLVVRSRGKEVLVPAVKEICREVDVQARQIRVHLDEELFGLNEI